MTDRYFLASAAFLLAASAAPAVAQDTPPATNADAQIAQDFDKDTVTVGIGGAYVPQYDGSNDYHFSPGPLVIGSAQGFNFTVIGNRASLDLIPSHPGQKIDFQLGPIAVLNFDRSSLKSIDDVRIRALGKRSTTLEVGGFAGIGKTGIITSPYDRLAVSLSYRQGVSGAHDSYLWQPSINYITPLSRKAAVGFYGSALYAGQGYADTYYSITPTQSIASTLPAFSAHKGWKSYTAGGFATYSLTGNLLHGFKVLAGGAYTRLLNDFSYSPVVRITGSKNQWLGAVGVAYTF